MNLEPASAGGGRRAVISLGLVAGAFLVEARAAAGEEDDDCGDQVADGGDEQSPHGGSKLRGGTSTGAVDGVLEDGEADEVGDEDHKGDEESEQADDCREERADNTSAESEQERDEGQASSHRVQNHNASETVGGVGSPVGGIEGTTRGGAQDISGVVADVASGALVIAARLLDTVSKSTEGDVRVVLVIVLW